MKTLKTKLDGRWNDDAEYKKIAKSVDAFGDASIWMEDGINELHSHYRDLSVFWEFHRLLHLSYY